MTHLDTECRPWDGRTNADGYGVIGKKLAHKVLWEAEHGPVPEGYELDHLCRVRVCVELLHLEVVTHAENLARSMHPNFVTKREGRCQRDHLLTPDNVSPSNPGKCRLCINLNARQRRARQKELVHG